MRDNVPWFPVMGEMHYSRFKEDFWEESLRKMKAGGVTVVSTYAIWIHHEEEKGVFDFSGCRNLKRFLELCRKVGLYVFLRLGPWVHGEVRNGGFPDWLMKLGEEGVALRSDDETYLKLVRNYWERLYREVADFFETEQGTVIGIQLENEYGHVGGLQGEPGEKHMRTLEALAKEIGFRVPFYTATGWGGACIGDCLPVMGGYCEAPWDQRITELEPNANFVFSHIRNDALIASDHHVKDELSFEAEKYPYLTAELGGGLQVTEHRRPVATGKDAGAMSLVKLGSGAALLGYYMYHGGSNPEGKLSTLQEAKATGYLNNLPEINYDFNAPIRQYGTICEAYREIRRLALFLKDFGSDLAPLGAEIPEGQKPGDLQTLRAACRHDEKHGYVFFNNYQRRWRMADHPGVRLKGITEQGEVVFPPIAIQDGAYGFFPYNMDLDGAVLRHVTATPLCRLNGPQGNVYVFYGDCRADFCWADEKAADCVLLSGEDSLCACKVTTDQDYLILADDFVWEEEGSVRVMGGRKTVIRVFPALTENIPGFVETGKQGRFTVYERIVETQEPGAISADVTPVSATPAHVTLADKTSADTTPACAEETAAVTESREKGVERIYEVDIQYGATEQCGSERDVVLWISYLGNKMDIYLDGKKINDHFYTGQEVPVSLRYFGFPQKLKLVIYPLRKDEPVYLESWPEMEEDFVCGLDGVRLEQVFW